MKVDEVKTAYMKFLSADDTQAFIFTFIGFSAMRAAGLIDVSSYTKIMMVASGAFFGQKLTNR